MLFVVVAVVVVVVAVLLAVGARYDRKQRSLGASGGIATSMRASRLDARDRASRWSGP